MSKCNNYFVLITIFILGQSIKDIVQWPRPACPPVVRLQTKWSIEFGMPSTHAMISITVPYSVLHYISNRYQVIYQYLLFSIKNCLEHK